MTNNLDTSLDPYAIPPAGGPLSSGSRPPRNYGRHPEPIVHPDEGLSAAPMPAASPNPRALLLRMLPLEQVLATLGISDQDFLAWTATGRGWATYALPDGRRLVDPAEVLAVLGVRNGEPA